MNDIQEIKNVDEIRLKYSTISTYLNNKITIYQNKEEIIRNNLNILIINVNKCIN